MKGAVASEWMLAKALDSGKLRLIEHSHVAPPTGSGGAGTEEVWKFAALGAGTTAVEFQNAGEKGGAMVFRGGGAGEWGGEGSGHEELVKINAQLRMAIVNLGALGAERHLPTPMTELFRGGIR